MESQKSLNENPFFSNTATNIDWWRSMIFIIIILGVYIIYIFRLFQLQIVEGEQC
jgi:cell division protein FtsI/penicillin-binding protein 2